MAVHELYSKRQKRLRGDATDVFAYDDIPEKLRVQIVHILKDTIGQDREHSSYSGYEHGTVESIYSEIHRVIARELGVFTLSTRYNRTDESAIQDFFLKEASTEQALDIIEMLFDCINTYVRKNQSHPQYINTVDFRMNPDEAISELNARFREHAIGYQFEGSEIVRVDSMLAHTQIVKPVLSLLNDNRFIGANEEYLKAHEHYRHGRNKECLTDCLKAFESTIKTICKLKGWQYQENDTAAKLIKACFDNGLVPTFTQNQFTSLRNLLESGIPTIRNKLGGHGQGSVPQKVDDGMTRYGMNLTATSILFLIEQSNV